MRLHKDKKVKPVCDICFQEKPLTAIIGTIEFGSVEVCRNCEFRSNHNPNYIKFNSIKRLKWYMTLYKYEKEGYIAPVTYQK